AGDAVLDVSFHFESFLRILEAREHLLGAAFVGPGGNDRGEVVVAARVWVEVGADVDAVFAGIVHQLDDFVHAPPILLVRDLDVDDLDGDAGAPANVDGFADGIEHPGTLVADVGGEDAVVTLNDLAQFDNLSGGGERIGGTGGHARQAAGAVLYRLLDQRFHPLKLVLCRASMRIAHDAAPDRPQADEGDDVGGDTGFLDCVEIAAQRRPFDRLAPDRDARRREFVLIRAGGAAFAQDLGSDALHDLAHRLAVFENREIRIRVHIDEARGDDEAADIDLAFTGLEIDLAERGDLVPFHREVAVEPRVAGAVHDLPAAQHEIKGGIVLRRHSCGRRKGEKTT